MVQRSVRTHRADPSHPSQDSSGLLCIRVSLVSSSLLQVDGREHAQDCLSPLDRHLLIIRGSFLCKDNSSNWSRGPEVALCVSLLAKKQHFKETKTFPANITKINKQ